MKLKGNGVRNATENALQKPADYYLILLFERLLLVVTVYHYKRVRTVSNVSLKCMNTVPIIS